MRKLRGCSARPFPSEGSASAGLAGAPRALRKKPGQARVAQHLAAKATSLRKAGSGEPEAALLRVPQRATTSRLIARDPRWVLDWRAPKPQRHHRRSLKRPSFTGVISLPDPLCIGWNV